MAMNGLANLTKRAHRPVQGWKRLAAPSVVGLLLCGCSSLDSINPVNWWHASEGGKIAKDRPSPPGANDPDPNLGSVPSRPPPPNREEMKRITEGLVADRADRKSTRLNSSHT